jgi:hypothetical protein
MLLSDTRDLILKVDPSSPIEARVLKQGGMTRFGEYEHTTIANMLPYLSR